MNDLEASVRILLGDVMVFTAKGGGLKLRGYQEAVAKAVVDSVVERRGLSFVVMFPRQSGKNELQAQIEAYLLMRFSREGGEMVKVSPTWKPQCLNAMNRLERVLRRNVLTKSSWTKELGYIYRVGEARMTFLSGGKQANIVGATASLLLEVDEAQDIDLAKYDKEIAPMAAAYNATRVFWGTAWTSTTLLARERAWLRHAVGVSSFAEYSNMADETPFDNADAPTREGRVFVINAEVVSREVPASGAFVEEQVRRMGREHPMVRTQFFSEEIEAVGGLFTPERQALMKGDYQARVDPVGGRTYAVLVDVGGEAAASQGSLLGSLPGQPSSPTPGNSGQDSTALTVVEVDLAGLDDPVMMAPIYRVMFRKEWVGEKHSVLYGEIKALCDLWQARYTVVDATGVGAGLASFLDKVMPGRVIPFVFSQKSKSELGWDFLSVVETGRFKDAATAMAWLGSLDTGQTPVNTAKDGRREIELQEKFWVQVRHCQGEVTAGPGRVLRWGVPDGTRDAEMGELVHDDLLVSAALCAVLDKQVWGKAVRVVIEARDVMEAMREVF